MLWHDLTMGHLDFHAPVVVTSRDVESNAPPAKDIEVDAVPELSRKLQEGSGSIARLATQWFQCGSLRTNLSSCRERILSMACPASCPISGVAVIFSSESMGK